jgi:hypothetical protein
MPRILLLDPMRTAYRIDSRNPKTIQAWFDELLPVINPRPTDEMVTEINVQPLWTADGGEADWLADSRVIGDVRPFLARNGRAAMHELEQLRADLQAQLRSITVQQARRAAAR